MERQYPRTKFARENSISKQMKHIASEMNEFANAYLKNIVMAETDNKSGEAEALKDMMLEAHDITQSAYTLMDILEREYPGQAWSVLEEMIEKNRVRGYYREGKQWNTKQHS